MSISALSDESSSQYVAMVWLANWMATIPPDELGRYTKKRLVQRWALAVLYLELNGPNWLNGADDWMGEDDACDWLINNNQGSCNLDLLVESLDLSNNNLRGTLPSEISLLSEALCKLPNPVDVPTSGFVFAYALFLTLAHSFHALLARLEMDRNFISGPLPQNIGALRQLGTCQTQS
jgi:hypothetical protein